MDVDGESRGYTFEELDLIEAKMKREDEVEARRLAADDEWADRVVAEQEQLEARKAAEAAKRPPVASVSAKEEECRRFAAALAPFGLTVDEVDGAGRGLATTRAFAAGELLLRVAPTAAVVDGASADSRCHESFALPKEGASLQRCSGCRFARYACAARQRDAWRCHQHECTLLKATRPRVPGATLRLLARLLRLPAPAAPVGSAGGAAGVDGADGGAAAWAAGSGGLMALSSALEMAEIAEERKLEMGEQAAMLSGLLAHATPGQPAPPPWLVAGILGRIATNALAVTDDELQPIGLGMYPLAALANHSCDPTAAQTFDGATLELRALRPLAAGAPDLTLTPTLPLTQAPYPKPQHEPFTLTPHMSP